MEYKIIYYDNGNKQCETWCLNNQHHRLDGPAYIEYYQNGSKRYEEWYVNNKIQRSIKYYLSGDKQIEKWYVNGKLQRIIEYHGKICQEKWYQNGKLHRPIEEGPAKIWHCGDSKTYFLNGEIILDDTVKQYINNYVKHIKAELNLHFDEIWLTDIVVGFC